MNLNSNSINMEYYHKKFKRSQRSQSVNFTSRVAPSPDYSRIDGLGPKPQPAELQSLGYTRMRGMELGIYSTTSIDEPPTVPMAELPPSRACSLEPTASTSRLKTEKSARHAKIVRETLEEWERNRMIGPRASRNSNPDYKGPCRLRRERSEAGECESKQKKEQSEKKKPQEESAMQWKKQKRVGQKGNEASEDDNISSLETNQSPEPTYCKCMNLKRKGKMIECSNKICPYQWWHFKCAGMRTQKGTKRVLGSWFCPECRLTQKNHKLCLPSKELVRKLQEYNNSYISKINELKKFPLK